MTKRIALLTFIIKVIEIVGPVNPTFIRKVGKKVTMALVECSTLPPL